VPESLVSNVSDTARWVAVYRAEESARLDGLFKDPFAERLAGERGRAIAAKAARVMLRGLPIIIRTKIIDDYVLASVAEGCDLVLNLAAGLDTRPYRLPLPAELSWVEADLPAMIEEKEKLLAGENPACRLTREKVNLADQAARTALLTRALEGRSRALVITEGLLGYLDEDVVRAMSRDFLSRPAVRFWVLDLFSPAILRMMQKGMGRQLENAPLKFAPPNGVAFFEALGWKVRELRSFLREAQAVRRLPFFMRWMVGFFPEPDPRNLGGARWSGIVRLERG
jgi:methyltransferase (TIGR00027 family)